MQVLNSKLGIACNFGQLHVIPSLEFLNSLNLPSYETLPD